MKSPLLLPSCTSNFLVYTGLIEDNRKAIAAVGEIDPITEDMLIGQTAELEKFQWFVRAYLENSGGRLANEGASTEKSAAAAARPRPAPRPPPVTAA